MKKRISSTKRVIKLITHFIQGKGFKILDYFLIGIVIIAYPLFFLFKYLHISNLILSQVVITAGIIIHPIVNASIKSRSLIKRALMGAVIIELSLFFYLCLLKAGHSYSFGFASRYFLIFFIPYIILFTLFSILRCKFESPNRYIQILLKNIVTLFISFLTVVFLWRIPTTTYETSCQVCMPGQMCSGVCRSVPKNISWLSTLTEHNLAFFITLIIILNIFSYFLFEKLRIFGKRRYLLNFILFFPFLIFLSLFIASFFLL